MPDPRNTAGHESHLSGPISGPVHTGSGNIVYNITLPMGKRMEFDASRLEALYKASILKRPELANVSTPLGGVEIHKLYVMPRLAPVSWIYGERKDREATDNTEPALEVMERFKRIVIFGAPGIGKSTFLKFVLRRMLDGQTCESFPIFLTLYQYTEKHNGRDLLTFAIDHYFRPVYQDEELEALGLLLRHWQSEGQLVFLLDGLDEVPSDKRESLLGQIRNLPRFVLTSRPQGRVDANQESGASFDILPFAPNEVARFVRNWQTYQAERPELAPEPFSAAEFFNYIRREPRIADLVRIPQLLTILCWLWGQGGSHRYGTKGALLVEAADRLIDKAVDLSGLAEEKRLTRSRDLRNGLAGLALEMLRQSRLRISTDEFIDSFAQVESTERGELLMLAQRSGLLIPTSGRADEWEFIHLVFQEFLAAEALVRHPDFETVLDRVLARIDFEECLRIASGLLCERMLQRYAPRLKVLIDKVMADENTDIFHLNWRLAGLCLSEVDEPERRVGSGVAELEVGLLECASEWWARQRFVEAIGRLRTAGMRQRLKESLLHENPYVRWAAAEALSQMADPATLEAILARIEEEDWQVIQGALASALGRIGDRRALPTIKRLLDKPGENSSIWWGVGEALGRLQDVATLTSLASLVSADEDSSEYGFSKAGSVYLSAHPYLSEEALMELHRFLDRSGVAIRGGPADAYILAEPTIEELRERANAEDPAARREAVFALGRIPSDDAIWELLFKLLDEDEDVSQTAGRMLRDMAEDGAALLRAFHMGLITALYDEDSEGREGVAWVLVQVWSMSEERELIWQQREKLYPMLVTFFKDASAMERLLALLASPQPFLVPAIWTLGLLGDPQHASRVVEFLEHENDLVRWATAWALGEFKDQATAQALLKCLHSGETIEVLQAACRSVGNLRVKEAAQPLVELLDAVTEIALRKAVIQSLGQIGATEAAGALLSALIDDESEVRVAAAEALGKIGGEQAIPPLVKALQDRSPAVQLAAATALGELKDPRAESKLIACLSSDDSHLRYAVIESLGKIEGGAATAQLLDLLENDPDEECARSAAEAFGKLADTHEILDLVSRVGDERDMVRMDAIASALLDRNDDTLRDRILERLAEKKTWGRVGRSCSLVQLRGGWGTLTIRSGTFLQQYGDERADRVEHCLDRLFDKDGVVAWEAAVALGDEEMRSASAVAPLILSLLDVDPWVAAASAETLGVISRESEFAERIRNERARALGWLQDQGKLANMIERLGEFELKNDWELPRIMRWALQDLLPLHELMQAYEQGNVQARLILWEIGDQYNLRFMSTGEVLLPSGIRVSCQEAVRQLLSQQ